ncbi:hypothetical protein HPP92_005381 [Vanilla planifolia]|uniref:Uncharacterized protein n=1 Tax=Vanilla planifolia TaxID=51239 RepID=A0A835RZF3_VANPL|nr:hypothetical protein HPP92_005682 [Vanilla planifolia]KAG0494387.1 hypothetical protein HPP92_005381 [Vanilla planifolia]
MEEPRPFLRFIGLICPLLSATFLLFFKETSISANKGQWVVLLPGGWGGEKEKNGDATRERKEVSWPLGFCRRANLVHPQKNPLTDLAYVGQVANGINSVELRADGFQKYLHSSRSKTTTKIA